MANMEESEDSGDDLFVPEGNFPWRPSRVHQPFKENNSESDPEVADASKDDSRDCEEDTTLYCVCRRPKKGLMIQCKACDDWIHGVCVGVNEANAAFIQNYFCPNCEKKQFRTTFKGAPDQAAESAERMAKARKRAEDEALTHDLIKRIAPANPTPRARGVDCKSRLVAKQRKVQHSRHATHHPQAIPSHKVSGGKKHLLSTSGVDSEFKDINNAAANTRTPTPLCGRQSRSRARKSSARAKTVLNNQDHLLKMTTQTQDDPLQHDSENLNEVDLQGKKRDRRDKPQEGGDTDASGKNKKEGHNEWPRGPSKVDILVRDALEAALFGKKKK